jgi:hypothetical protein
MSTEIRNLSVESTQAIDQERMELLATSLIGCADAVKRAPAVEKTYWGVKCRTCQELVAFDVCPYLSFGADAASMKPGAIRCSQGHNHIYFPRDFQFILSAVAIPDERMRVNRETYRAINSAMPSHQGLSIVKAKRPPSTAEVEIPVADVSKRDAQTAENDRWSHLGDKKAM